MSAWGVPTNAITNWGTADTQAFISQVRSAIGSPKGSGGTNPVGSGVDTNAVAKLRQELDSQKQFLTNMEQRLQSQITFLVQARNDVDTAISNGLHVAQGELRRALSVAVDAGPDVKSVEKRLLALMGTNQAELRGEMDAIVKAGGDKASVWPELTLFVVLVVVAGGLAVWWFRGPRKVLDRAARHLEPNDPSGLRGYIKNQFTLEKEGSIVKKVSDLEEGLKKALASGGLAKVGSEKQSAPASPPPPSRSPGSSPSAASVVAYPPDYEEVKKQLADLNAEVRGIVAREAATRGSSQGAGDPTGRGGQRQTGDESAARNGEARASENRRPSQDSVDLLAETNPHPLGGQNPTKGMAERAADYKPGVREQIGLCFVEFCRGEHTVYEADEFEVELRKVVTEARVQVGYRTSSAQEAYFHPERPPTSNSKGWVVTVGQALFLLPWAMSVTDFDTVIECFEMPQGTTPRNLKDCLPATLIVEGKRWGVVDQGRLSAQPDEKLQRWWLTDQKARQPKPQAVPKPLPAVAPVAVVAGQALEVPTTTTVGEAFVQFCKLAMVGVVAPPFDSFLKELERRFPGACLSGCETQVGSDSSVTVWQVLSGRAGQATKGWLLPAIKTLNEFHLFGDMFIPDGEPTPETVKQVIPAEINLEYRGAEPTWVPANFGKVSTRKPEPVAVSGGVAPGTDHSAGIAATQSSATPWEAEVMAAVGEAFLKACASVASKPETHQHKLDLQNALRNAPPLPKHNPHVQTVDVVSLNLSGSTETTKLKLAGLDGWGDAWLVTIKRGEEKIYLVTPRLAPERIPFRAAKRCFSLVSPCGGEAETLLVGSVTGFIPCLVRRVPKREDYEVVEPGKITMG